MGQESKTVKRYRRKVIKLTNELDRAKHNLELANNLILELTKEEENDESDS